MKARFFSGLSFYLIFYTLNLYFGFQCYFFITFLLYLIIVTINSKNMKKITLFLTFSLLCFSGFLSAQHNFGTVAGPVLVAQATPVTININDVGNTAGVPASPTGTYTSFSVSVDWSDNFDAWSSEADLSVITTAGTVLIDPATTGSANSGNATTMTFVGEFTAPYNPSTDGFLDILLRQSWGGSSANWSNIVVTIFPAPACIDPAGLLASNITPTSVDLIWTDPSGTQFDYEYVVQAAGVGMPAGAGNYVDIGDLPLTEPGLTQATLYEFWVRADCGANGFSNWVGPVNFRTSAEVVCGTPINTTHCYTDNDTTTWAFTSDDGSPLRVTFNAGGMESCCDEIIIYDGSDATGAILYQGNNGGNLAGLTFDSTTDSIFIVIDADGSISCGSGSACCTAQFDFTVACATCVNPTATFTNVLDCGNGEYSIDVDLTDLGSATSVTISDGTTTLTNINTTGIQTFGPYLSGSSVTIVITNEQDNSCTLSSGTLISNCPPANDECSGAITLTVNPDYSCAVQTPGTIAAATASAVDPAACGGTENDDVWFSFVATATTHRIQLNNVVGSTTDLYHSLWTGADCGSLTLVPGTCSDPNTSNPTGLTIGQTYYLRVYSWANATHNTTFNVCIGTPPPPPANDTCATAIPVDCTDVVTGSTANGATNTGGNTAADVWYSYSGAAGDITLSLCANTNFDSFLRVYDACGGTQIAFNDDGCGAQSTLTFTANGTSTYYIMVEGFSASTGNFELTVSCVLNANSFDNNNFMVYPNPVKDVLNLSYTSEISTVRVMNMLGQEVISKNLNAANAQVDMSQLSAGTYIVNVTIGDTVKTIKVVKQ